MEMVSSLMYERRNLVLVFITLLVVTSSEDLSSKIPSNSSVVPIIATRGDTGLHSSNSIKEKPDVSITARFSPLNGSDSYNSTDHELNDECPDLKCDTAVLLDPYEFNRMHDGRLHVRQHNKTFEKCEYLDLGNNVAVCESELLRTEENTTEIKTEHNLVFPIITLIGFPTSVVFIIFHLILFLLFPEMRNLPGCCLASLCVALVLAYINFLIAITVNILSKTSCVGVAMCIYYFFLASFFWMNVLAFDVCRALRAATTEFIEPDSKLPKRRFFFYSLYAWLTPMSLAILTQQIDASDHIPLKYRPRFADVETGMCWFREPHSLLLLFIIPFVVLMCLNILLFGISAYIIVTASFNSSEANKKMLVRKFFVFLRLALLMGLTWIFGIIISFTDSTPMIYLFVIGNAFQGLLIFLAFSCKPTVKKYFFRHRITFSSRTSSRTKEISFRPNTS